MTIAVVVAGYVFAGVFLALYPPFSPSLATNSQRTSEDLRAIWMVLTLGDEVKPVYLPRGVLTHARLMMSVDPSTWKWGEHAYPGMISRLAVTPSHAWSYSVPSSVAGRKWSAIKPEEVVIQVVHHAKIRVLAIGITRRGHVVWVDK